MATYVEEPYQLRLVFVIGGCHALRVLGCSKRRQLIGFAGEQFLLISSLLESDHHIYSQSSHEDDSFLFVNDIVMTVTLLAVLLYGTFKECYATLFISESTH